MDASSVLQILNDSINNVDGRSCHELMSTINNLDLVQIEGKKDELFRKRIEFICASNMFHQAIIRDYRRKQIKRFLVNVWEWEESRAATTAKSINEARLVMKHFPQIVNNCFKYPKVDIRSLNIHELYLAKNVSWVLRRCVDRTTDVVNNRDESVQLNKESIESTVQNLLNSNWYNEAKSNPLHVANVMKIITNRVLNHSIQRSGR